VALFFTLELNNISFAEIIVHMNLAEEVGFIDGERLKKADIRRK
jgi:hypothetical protein